MNHYRRAWGTLRRPLRRAVLGAPRATLVMHMPKTGGSSLAYGLRSSPEVDVLALPSSAVPSHACECGAPSSCVDHAKREGIESWRPSDRPLFVKYAHETYGAVEWVRGVTGDESLPVVMAVRPRRDRLQSMFTDYWTRVAIARGDLTDERSSTPHIERVLAKYALDAVHYRSADGWIDGVAWFTSFERHGAGVPFSLHEVFDGEVGRLERELDLGRLRLVTTARIDSLVEELTGCPLPARRRVSRTGDDPAVKNALAEATHIIDRLAERDAPFDRVIADRLGEPAFSSD